MKTLDQLVFNPPRVCRFLWWAVSGWRAAEKTSEFLYFPSTSSPSSIINILAKQRLRAKVGRTKNVHIEWMRIKYFYDVYDVRMALSAFLTLLSRCPLLSSFIFFFFPHTMPRLWILCYILHYMWSVQHKVYEVCLAHYFITFYHLQSAIISW